MTKVIEADRGFKVWWHLTRPHTLTASFVPVFLGTAIALAIEKETIDFGLFLLCSLQVCLYKQQRICSMNIMITN